jgi:hypothetical protein
MNLNRLTFISDTYINGTYDTLLKYQFKEIAQLPKLYPISISINVPAYKIKSSIYAIRFIAYLVNNFIVPIRSLYSISKKNVNQRLPSKTKKIKYGKHIEYTLPYKDWALNILLSFLLINKSINKPIFGLAAKVSEKHARITFRKFNVFDMRVFSYNPTDLDWNFNLSFTFKSNNIPLVTQAFKIVPRRLKNT